jgi:5'-nucleotidase / UDP-sugar diphosphatase
MKNSKLVRILCLAIIILCWSAPSWADQPVKLRLLYFNDFHGFAEPSKSSANPDQWGGIAYLAAEVNRLRKERPTLFLAAGDMIQGHPWANLFEGRSTIEVLNAMQVSAMVLGNHEFDFGQEALKKRIEEARFPILAANVRGLNGIRPYMITEAGGLRIAIIGLVTEHTPTATHPKNVKGLSFSSPITSAREVMRGLAPKPDLLIILSHLGFPADQRLAKAVPGIQVIVGGHTHTRIETPVQAEGTLIVQAWEHGKVLGLLDLTLQNGKVLDYEGRLIPILQEAIKPDPQVAQIVESYNLKAKALLEEVIGEALVDLQAEGSRIRETNLGNFVADILREDTRADAALINGGGLRDDILKGPIRGKDLLSVLPFRNFPLAFRVNGRELKAILEHGFSNLSGGAGGFPQVSGMRVTYNPAAPVGERINGLWIKDKPVDPETWYTLATYDFLASGGDGYSIIADLISLKEGYPVKNPRLVLFESGRDIREITEAYIKNKKKVSAQIEGRIRISQ